MKKSLIGLPFNPKENSTTGIEVDPSLFQVDVDEAQNWKPIDGSKQGLLGCSKAVAEVVVEKLFIPVQSNRAQEEKKETHANDLHIDDYKNWKQVGDTEGEKEDLFVSPAGLSEVLQILINLVYMVRSNSKKVLNFSTSRLQEFFFIRLRSLKSS